MLPFTPLIISSSLIFPFITGKAFFFRIVVGIIFLAWAALAVLNRDYLPKRSWILFSVISFLAVLSFSALFGVNPYRSFWSNFERMEGLITLLHLGGLFIVFSSVFEGKSWRSFFHISLGVSLIICFYGLLQLTGNIEIRQGGVRLDGTLGNAIYLAVYMMFHIFIAAYYFIRNHGSYRYLYIPLIIFQFFILYNTATRGVILSTLFGVVVSLLLLFIFERGRSTLRQSAGFSLILILILVGAFWFSKDTSFVRNSPVLSRFSGLSIESIKDQGRFFVWPMAIEGFKNRPILGYGQENFIYVFNENYNPAMYSQEPWFDRVHNVYLDWLIAGGILGLLSFLMIFGFAVFYLWRTQNFSVREKSILSGLIAAYLCQGIFDFDNLTSYLLIFSILAFIYHKSASGARLSVLSSNVSKKFSVRFLLPFFVIVFLVVGYFFHYKPILAAKTIIDAIHPQTSNQESINHFEKFFSYNTFGGQEGTRHFLSRASVVIGTNNEPDDLKYHFFNLSEETISRQIKRFPLDADVFISSGIFYRQAGQYEKSLEMFESAVRLSPHKQNIHFEIASTLFSAGRPQEALEKIKFAMELWPANPEAQMFYIMAMVINGNFKDVEDIFSKLPDHLKYFDDRLLNILAGNKYFSAVLEIWHKRVESDPDNVFYRQSLVASYLSLGRLNEAIEELENIVAIEPGFKETADYAIGEIRAGRGANLLSD